jgi:hypothetical protein
MTGKRAEPRVAFGTLIESGLFEQNGRREQIDVLRQKVRDGMALGA